MTPAGRMAGAGAIGAHAANSFAAAAAMTPRPGSFSATPQDAPIPTPSFDSELDFDDFLGPRTNGQSAQSPTTAPTTLPNPRVVQARRRKANQRLTLVLALLTIVLLIVAVIVLNRPDPAPDETTPSTGPAIIAPSGAASPPAAAATATGGRPASDAPEEVVEGTAGDLVGGSSGQ